MSTVPEKIADIGQRIAAIEARPRKRVRAVQYVVQPVLIADDGTFPEPLQVEPITIPASEWDAFVETGLANALAELEAGLNPPAAPRPRHMTCEKSGAHVGMDVYHPEGHWMLGDVEVPPPAEGTHGATFVISRQQPDGFEPSEGCAHQNWAVINDGISLPTQPPMQNARCSDCGAAGYARSAT